MGTCQVVQCRNITWTQLSNLKTARVKFLILAVNDVPPSLSNLHYWHLENTPAFPRGGTHGATTGLWRLWRTGFQQSKHHTGKGLQSVKSKPCCQDGLAASEEAYISSAYRKGISHAAVFKAGGAGGTHGPVGRADRGGPRTKEGQTSWAATGLRSLWLEGLLWADWGGL